MFALSEKSSGVSGKRKAVKRATTTRGQGASERTNLDRHHSDEPQPQPEKKETAGARPKGNQTKPTRRKEEQED